MRVRKPAVSGTFYPSDPHGLKDMLKSLFVEVGYPSIPKPAEGSRLIKALMSPHAGYIYSGRTAAAGYGKLASDGYPDTFVIIGPNHTGLGASISVSSADYWETPLGKVPVDLELAKDIVEMFDEATFDDLAHMAEHSVEVQVPFIQAIWPNSKIVPIVMALQDPAYADFLGKVISIASNRQSKDVVVIASSDMSHYLPEREANLRDRAAIDAILEMDIQKLFRVIVEMDVSMCGPGPVATAISFAKNMGANRAELVRYSTSAETSRDYDHVVGYASVVFLE